MSNARRPRLVEEGKPIMRMTDDDDDDSSHHVARRHSSPSMYHHDPNHQQSLLPNVLQQNHASSSLIQYLSSHYNATTDNNFTNHNHHNTIPSMSPNKKRTTTTKLQTKFTIGSSNDDDATNIDDDDDDDVTMNIDQEELQDQYNDVHSYKSDPHPHISSYKDYNDNHEKEERMIQRMEIEDIIPKPPLIVLDGANIAYAYVQTFQSTPSLSTTRSGSRSTINCPSTSLEPNALGIKLAVEYFLHAGCRVQVVVPAYWIRNKPQHQQHYTRTTNTNTNHSQHLQILHHLQEQNILCCSPPTDDDDAYCIAIARREDGRSRLRRKGRHYNTTTTSTTTPKDGSSINTTTRTSINATTANTANTSFHSLQESNETSSMMVPSSLVPSDITMMDGAFIVSNDLYRDAIYRDPTHELKRWLEGAFPLSNASSSIKHKYSKDGPWRNVDDIPRRISYSFADLGSIDTYGDAILDFVPNPRHALISMIDRETRKQFYSHESF